MPERNLSSVDPEFVGREDILAEIRGALTGAPPPIKVSAITGLGGVGKTQTALAYCYIATWPTTADLVAPRRDVGHARRGLCSLAAPWACRRKQDQAKLVQAVKARLQTTRDWLLVLDNAEDPAVVRSYLPGHRRWARADHFPPHGLARYGGRPRSGCHVRNRGPAAPHEASRSRGPTGGGVGSVAGRAARSWRSCGRRPCV